MLEVFKHKKFFSILTILLYLILFSIFLISTDGIPYILDNNESFSNLIHAENMYEFGIRNSFGLTDEATGLSAEAHPYVYTHQGNFPRFYSFLLYVVGFVSPESQIIITTFTIGILGIFLGYLFFSQKVSPAFSFIFSSLLITDYIMFTQWQVNTWRVWHCFFFFSSLICWDGFLQNKHRSFIFLMPFNFLCLAYTEITYSIFVSLICCGLFFWATKKKKRFLLTALLAGAGLMLGGLILAIQNILFSGWEGFLTDLKYAFISRNNAQYMSPQEKYKIIEFYHNKGIVFWENFSSSRQVSALSYFFPYFFKIYSYYPRLINAFSLILFLSPLAFLLKKKICVTKMETKMNFFYTKEYLFVANFYFICFISFLLTYLSNSGYIKSAYIDRQCCLTVFFHLIPLSWSFYICCKLIFDKTIDLLIRLIILFSLALTAYCWGEFQLYQVHKFKPFYHQLLKSVKKTIPTGSIIASNNYGAPWAYMTKSVSFLDSSYDAINIQNKKSKHTNDFRYLWVADKNKNPKYKKPDFYIYVRQRYTNSDISGSLDQCSQIISSARARKRGLKELARNLSFLPQKDLWSIIDLRKSSL